jgi:hypothetical protein
VLWLGVAFAPTYAANRADWWVYVTNDDARSLRELLARGADPNVRYKDGQPALMQAVAEGAWKVFDVLTSDPRTDLTIENPASETPLMYLAVIGQTERMRQLIARGVDVNRLGWTPLHYAASKGHLGAAQLLLEHQAMVNAPAPDGTTPLMMAAYAGSREVVQLLLRAGADPTPRNLKGQSAADWALMAKAGGLAEELKRVSAQVQREREAMRAGPSSVPKIPPLSAEPAKPARDAAVIAPPAGVNPVMGVSGIHTDERNLPTGH